MKWNPEELESVNCDLCENSSNNHIFTRPDGLQVLECNRCGLCFISPRPKSHLIYRLYDKDYFDKQKVSSDIGFLNYTSELNRKGMLKASQKRFEMFKQSTHASLSRCLEIGCATGEFCNVLKQEGIKPTGIDLSDFAISQAESKYSGIDFRKGDIECLENQEMFDAIFAFELIEHVLSPKIFFERIRQHLMPNGFLVVSTPNYESGRTVGYERWVGFNKSFEHLYFFSPTILCDYAKQNHLSLHSWFTGGGNGIVSDRNSKMKAKLFVRNMLDKTGMLDFLRDIRDNFRKDGQNQYNDYIPKGNNHNLFMIFRAN